MVNVPFLVFLLVKVSRALGAGGGAPAIRPPPVRHRALRPGSALRLLAVTLAVALLGACSGEATGDGDSDPKSKLVGTWQQDFEFQGAKAHLVLALGADRKFTERIEFLEPDGRTQRQDYAGEWAYDGLKFTRRYLQENGRQYSGGKLRFATLDLTSITNREMVGKDNLRGEVVVYRRAAPGASP
jgi:hypothetical protein